MIQSSGLSATENPKQLTHDGKPKPEALLSPLRNRVVYTEGCGEKSCTPVVVIINLQGRRVGSFRPSDQCAVGFSLEWVGRNAIAAECHINPSLGAYTEADVLTGKTTRDLLGNGFTRSPDGQKVAYGGWIPHFAPPYAKSSYLQVEDTVIYPLPKGMPPILRRGLKEPPDVIRKARGAYFGIHQFSSRFAWSPDFQRIALIDCTYDWTPSHPGAMSAGQGSESKRNCFVVAVSTRGESVILLRLQDGPMDPRLVWTNPHQLSLEIGGTKRNIPVP